MVRFPNRKTVPNQLDTIKEGDTYMEGIKAKAKDHDFVRIGKEQVLNKLFHQIKNKADAIPKAKNAEEKLLALKELKELSDESYQILESLI